MGSKIFKNAWVFLCFLMLCVIAGCHHQHKVVVDDAIRDMQIETGLSRDAAIALYDCEMKPSSKDSPRASTLQSCKELGGDWQLSGSGHETCYVPTPDANKSCHDASECAALCLAPAGKTLGEKAVGTCSSFYRPLAGCRALMCSGYVGYELCID